MRPGRAPPQIEDTTATDLLPVDHAIRDLKDHGSGDLYFGVAFGNPLDVLDAAEETLTAAMTPARRGSFVAGRVAARRALLEAGHAHPVVTSDRDSVPLFPAGYIGSISHKYGLAVAVAALSSSAHGLGIDLEYDDDRDEADLLATVCHAAERASLAQLREGERDLASTATLLLSAKEAIYKAVFPLVRIRFDFDEVEVAFNPENRTFMALQWPGRCEAASVVGWYALTERWILTVARFHARRVAV